MANYAIIIGIDAYADKKWALDSAVSDALGFAAWCVTRGGVDPAAGALRLHLAAKGGNASGSVALPGTAVTVDYRPAESREIDRTILNDFHRDGLGKDGDRLYVYYAGHGCSHPGIRGDKRAEPVLIPSDVRELPLDWRNLVSFSDMLEPLRGCGPANQYFFIDACRDFGLDGIVGTGGSAAGRYVRPLSILAQHSRRQYAVYATAPGERANELGKGVFGAALLSALELHPRAILRIAGAARYELQFSPMFDFVRAETARTIENSIPIDAARFVQTPESDPEPGHPNPVLASIGEADVPDVELPVQVSPKAARDGGSLSVFYDQYLVGPRLGPPLKRPAIIRVKPAYYRVEIEAVGFRPAQQTVIVPPSEPIEIQLEAAGAGPPDPTPTMSASPILRFHCIDKSAYIVIWKPDGTVQAGAGEVGIDRPAHGVYRAHLLSPEGQKLETLVDFPTQNGTVELSPAPPAMPPEQVAMLGKAGINATGNYMAPSESMGPMANLRLASLLGFAAYAANTAPMNMMTRLRSVGAAQVDATSGPQLLILIGAAGIRPAGSESVASFLEDCRIGGSERSGRLKPLPGFPAAAQFSAPLQAGGSTVDVRMPGVPITRHAVAGLPGRVSVLVLVAGDDGSVESQLYMFALRGHPNQPPVPLEPEQLRLMEQAQRFYAGSEPMPEPLVRQMLNDLLPMKWQDPVLGCLAGYSLVRMGRAHEFAGEPMHNMLAAFPELPDVHVLAALCQPEMADRHFARAIEAGIPVFSEGFEALLDHYRRGRPQGVEELPPPVARAGRTLISGAPFSSWVAWEPVLRVKGKSIEKPPFIWQVLETQKTAIEAALPAVGLLRAGDEPRGTAFLVGPDLVLSFFFGTAADGDSNKPLGFDPSNDPSRSKSANVIPGKSVATDSAAKLRLMKLARPVEGVVPLRIAGADDAPAPNTKLYIIGYPQDDMRIDPALRSAVFGKGLGIKRLAPGELLAAPDDSNDFSHDAFTMGGNGGSPVIALDSGLVIGLQHSGFIDHGLKVGYATALWKFANSPILRRLTGKARK